MAKAAPPPDVVSKVRKLAQIAADLRLGKHYSITCLTTLKSLCKEPKVAANFALHMAKLTRDQIEREPCPKQLQPEEAVQELVQTLALQLFSSALIN